MKRRMEYTKGTSSKFWEISYGDSNKVKVEFGRIAARTAQSLTKTYDSLKDAIQNAEKQIAAKKRKGYQEVNTGVKQKSLTPSTGDALAKRPVTEVPMIQEKKPLGIKKAVTPEKTFADALMAWVKAAAAVLEAPNPLLRSVKYTKGVVTVITGKGRAIKGKISAPTAFLGALWRDERKILRGLCFEKNPGEWTDVEAVVRWEGASHDRYMELLSATLLMGQAQEARLGWLRANFVDSGESDELFRTLFPTLPRSVGPRVTGSAVAYLERQMPLANLSNAVDRLIIATDLYAHMGDAFEVVANQHKRAEHFMQQVESTITLLAKSDEPAVREMTNLCRLFFANLMAFTVIWD